MNKPARRDVSKYCKGEKCGFVTESEPGPDGSRYPYRCGDPAEYKVEEVIFDDDPQPVRHPLTQYLCPRHFRWVMGLR